MGLFLLQMPSPGIWIERCVNMVGATVFILLSWAFIAILVAVFLILGILGRVALIYLCDVVESWTLSRSRRHRERLRRTSKGSMPSGQ